MANTLTGLQPLIFRALDTVSRELTGAISQVRRDASLQTAAVNQTIRYPVTPTMTSSNITPAATGPDPSAQTIGNDTLTISKSKSVNFFWEGEEQLGTAELQNILQDQFAQSFRTLGNEIETDLCTEAYTNASRGYGTAATNPFASDFNAVAEVRKILDDNGAPMDRSMIINTAAGAALRNNAQLTKANEAASDSPLRDGTLLDIHGFRIAESAQVVSHTAGTGSGYVANGGEPAGETTIAVDTGTGTILAGDVVTYAADTTNKYMVNTALSGGTFTIGGPGTLVAVPDSNAFTVGADYTANFAFSRDAMLLVTRAPADPVGGDSADETILVQDPRTGLGFQIKLYRQYRRVSYDVGIAWGYKAVKPAHIAVLIG